MQQPNSFPVESHQSPDHVLEQSGDFNLHEEHGLKTLSEDELFQNLLESGADWTDADRTMVTDAYRLGRGLHADDKHRDKPYVYHLLRNANRITEYAHIRDAEVVAGAILHDSVEDHPEEFAAHYSSVQPDDVQAQRTKAYEFLRTRFTPRVAAMVEGMTNPLRSGECTWTYEQKIQHYVGHIAVAIRNTDVFFGKWADWADNGVGIEHSREDLEPEQEEHFMYKYGQVLPVLESRYAKEDIQVMLDPVAKANLERTFELARERLLVPE